MKLLGWHDVLLHPAWRGGDVADLRSRELARAGRPRGAVSLPVPCDARPETLAAALPSAFLPPRHRPLLLVGDDADVVATAVHWLRARRPRERRRRRPGRGGRAARSVEQRRPPAGRPPVASAGVPRRACGSAAAAAAGPVVDLGAGGGRAAVWLALRGYDVTAVDRLPDALELCRRLAADAGTRVTTLRRDLTRTDAAPPGPWSVALAFRFLDRRLLAALPGLLSPGGVAVVRTFRYDPTAERLPRRTVLPGGGGALRALPRLRLRRAGFGGGP